jgi:hypothetical protein
VRHLGPSDFALTVSHSVDTSGTEEDGGGGCDHQESERGPIFRGLLEDESRGRLEEVLVEWNPVWAGGELRKHVDLVGSQNESGRRATQRR